MCDNMPKTSKTPYQQRKESLFGRQLQIDACVATMRQIILDAPHIRMSCIAQQVVDSHQLENKGELVSLLGGGNRFRMTCRRLEILRWAVNHGQQERLPCGFDTDSERDMRYRRSYYRRDENSEWRAPDIMEIHPFEKELPHIDGAPSELSFWVGDSTTSEGEMEEQDGTSNKVGSAESDSSQRASPKTKKAKLEPDDQTTEETLSPGQD